MLHWKCFEKNYQFLKVGYNCTTNLFPGIIIIYNIQEFIFFLFISQGEDSSGQRYSADPTGLITERGAKGDKDQDGFITAMRDKNNSGYFAL